MFQIIFKNNPVYFLKIITVALAVIVGSFLSVRSANAASLYFSPALSETSVGNIVTLKVLVGTDSKIINNSDAVVEFPADLLEVISISKNSSIFTMWVEEPRFSNIEGKITYNGGLPNPGYVGQDGQVLSVTFRARKQGNASVTYSDSAVRQNDGLGTDILTLKQSASIKIVFSQQIVIPIIDSPATSLPSKPIIISSTHPQQSSWYKGNSATFSWNVPNNVKSLQTLLSKNANAIPTVSYDSSVSQRTVNNLSDGVMYFNMRYMNNLGWGPVASYKVQIDSVPPEKFDLIVKNQDVKDIVTLNAVDLLSGIDSYSVKIDENPAVIVKKDSMLNNEFILPTQSSGEHMLFVTAYDKAGNQTDASTAYNSLDILAPSISVLSEQITRGETIVVSGKSEYPNTPVDIFIQNSEDVVKKYSLKTSRVGSFNLVSDDMDTPGRVRIWAQINFSSKLQSPVSNIIYLSVKDGIVVQVSKSVIYVLFYLTPMILLLLILIFTSYLGWHKFFGLKKKIKKETKIAIDDTHEILKSFKKELNNQLNKIEEIKNDRDLNNKEEKIFRCLQNNIDDIDKYIENELRKYL